MKIHSYGKKLMAVACAVVMLVSCMVFAPVSAAKTEIFKADFEATYPYCTKEGSGNTKYNVVKSNNLVYAKQAKDGSNGVMELYYGKNADVAAFRVLDAEGQVPQTVANTPYRISFRYKVVNMPTSMLLSFVPNNAEYNSSVYDRFNGQSVHHKIVLDEDTPQGEWLNASFAWVPGSGGSYFNLGLTYVKVNGTAPEAIIGAKVLIDDVVIETMEDGDYLKVQHNYNYENAGFNNYQGCEGDALWKTPDARSGYHFDGWFTAAEGGEQVTTFTSAHTNIYAHWSQAVEVTFDADGTTATRTLGVGNSITRTAPDKVHYKFIGWTTEKDNADTLVDTVTADMSTLYAYYEQTEYVITFDPKIGDTQEQVVSVADAADTVVKFPTLASRAGYRLDGWNDGETTLTGDALTDVPVTGDITYTAVWTKTGEVPEVDGLQSFEDGEFTNLYNTTRTGSADPSLSLTKAENHTFAGEYSIVAHIKSGLNGERSRPRMVLQDGKGNNFVAEEGKSYTVSFWAKSNILSNAATFYLAAQDIDDIEKQINQTTKVENNDCHTLQSILINDTKNEVMQAGDSSFPTTWKQYVVTIPSFVAHKAQNAAATTSYLVLGFTDRGAYGDSYIERDYYIDDIQIAETDTLENVLTYEALGSNGLTDDDKYGGSDGNQNQLFGTGNARYFSQGVVPDHSFGTAGAGKVARIKLTDNAGNFSNCYFGLHNTDGTKLTVATGKSYYVSAWVYAQEELDLKVLFRTTENGGNWCVSGNTTGANNYAAPASDQYALTVPANTWTKVSYLATIPAELQGAAKAYNRLAIGFAKANSEDNSKAFDLYIDDVSVTELTDTTDTLDSFAGNAALYSKGNDTAYSDGYGAMRFLGGYQTVDGDATKAVIGGVTYTVKQRGIILGSETQTGLTLTSESLKVSEATKGLENYWEMRNGSFVTFSLLIKNVAAARTPTKYNFRPYVTVEVNGAEVTLYGKEYDSISWDDVFAKALKKNPDLDKSWTNSAE